MYRLELLCKTTFNNTIVSFTDKKGNVVSWSSARCNFSSRKLLLQLQLLHKMLLDQQLVMEMKEVESSGTGAGRESAVRVFNPQV